MRLNRHLLSRIDLDRYPLLTPDVERSPILTLGVADRDRLASRLRAAHVVATLSPNYLRVSPALYNDERDVERLAELLRPDAKAAGGV